MKIKLQALAIATLSLWLTVGQAQEEYQLSGGHPFVGLGLGAGFYNNPSTQNTTGDIASIIFGRPNTDLLWQLDAGYLWYNENYAYGAEFIYSGLADVSKSKVSVSNVTTHYTDTARINSYSFLAVGRYFFNRFVYMDAKLGASVLTQQFQGIASNTTQINSSNQTFIAPSFGISGGTQLNDHLAFNMDLLYSYVNAPRYGTDNNGANGRSSLTTLTMGIAYNF